MATEKGGLGKSVKALKVLQTEERPDGLEVLKLEAAAEVAVVDMLGMVTVEEGGDHQQCQDSEGGGEREGHHVDIAIFKSRKVKNDKVSRGLKEALALKKGFPETEVS